MIETIILSGQHYENYKLEDYNVVFVDIYNRNIPKILLRLFRNIPLFVYFSLGCWKNNIKHYKTIIVFDTDTTEPVLNWIDKKNKATKKIFYYRNSITWVRNFLKPERLKVRGYQLWSYNISDCNKYNLKYNNQMLDKSMFKNIKQNHYPKYDVLFLGNSKGRENILVKVENQLRSIGRRCYVYIPDLSGMENNMCKNGKSLPYTEYIELIYQSKAILDIVTDKNWGLTYRPIEAMFSKRKLITNYDDIKKYDFFNTDNIYILDSNEDFCNIKYFLNSEYKPLNKEIIDEYDITRWYEHFAKSNSILK